MSTIYDDVAADARDDHRHNPPGYAPRPIGRQRTSDEVLELFYEEHYHDLRNGAYDETPDHGFGDEAA
jgi:hypothetical protein